MSLFRGVQREYLRDWEVNFISRCFEYYKQEGKFEVKLDLNMALFVKFYSARFMADMMLVPSNIMVSQKDGIMFVKQDEILPKIKELYGLDYRKTVEAFTWVM